MEEFISMRFFYWKYVFWWGVGGRDDSTEGFWEKFNISSEIRDII